MEIYKMGYELAEDKKNKFGKKFDQNVFKSDKHFDDWLESFAFNQSEKHGMCLIYAAMRGEAEIVKGILARGVPIHFRSRRRCDFPVEGSHPDDVHFNVLCGTTALHLALTNDVRKLLVSNQGLLVDITDASGRTPLVCQVINNDIRGIQFMMALGCNINYCDLSKYSVLHYAVFTNNQNTVKCVLAYRPKMTVDSSGNTPADYARNYSEFSASSQLFAPPAVARPIFGSDSPVTSGTRRNRLIRTTHLQLEEDSQSLPPPPSL
jgi:hypothetical protein